MEDPNKTKCGFEIPDFSEKSDKNNQEANESIDRSTKWSELMVGKMIMSPTEFDLTLDVQETSIKLFSEDNGETVEFVVKPSERVEIIVNGATRADISSFQVLEEIRKELEEKNITTKKEVRGILKGKHKNFFTGFTTLVTLLKLTFFMKRKAQEAKTTKKGQKYGESQDSQIGPYF